MTRLVKLLWLSVFLFVIVTRICTASQKIQRRPLCALQLKTRPGEHRLVRVSGIYSGGFEMGVLKDATCPDERTWVELDLKSAANKEQLQSLVNGAGKAQVEFEGEFYGPGLPDPKLPDVLKKSSHPGWGHLGAFRTKLVVHLILSAKPLGKQHGH